VPRPRDGYRFRSKPAGGEPGVTIFCSASVHEKSSCDTAADGWRFAFGQRCGELSLICAGAKTSNHQSIKLDKSMLGTCANPSCLHRFRYLHEGRLFVLRPPVRTGQSSPVLDSELYRNSCATQWFWLCGECSRRMELVCTPGHRVAVSPIMTACEHWPVVGELRPKRNVAVSSALQKQQAA
jgi:hypothetical protein